MRREDVTALVEALETCLEMEERPKVIELARAALAAAQRPTEDGCHCATCTCNPNMTPAVRFDLSPAQMEGAIRDHLIRLGWTPPDERAMSQQPEERGGGESEPPSAPVGVDFAAVASILRRAMRDGAHYGYRRDFILQQALALEALSQQPAGVDGPDAQAAEIESLRAEVAEAREFRDKLANAIGNDQLRRFIEKHGEPVPLTIRMQAAEARAERLADALRELVDVFSESGMYDEEVFVNARKALEQEDCND